MESWELNVLGIADSSSANEPFFHYFQFIRDNHKKIAGDIVEVGVFRGRSLLATALLLRDLGSDKIVYGYDSFGGFPSTSHPMDDLSRFDELAAAGCIDADHLRRVKTSIRHREFLTGQSITAANVSTSGSFSDTSLDNVKRKIDYLELSNIRLIQGSFADTMSEHSAQDHPTKICAALVDCDLYESYQVSLPFIWDRLSIGGYVYLDEYYSLKFPGARVATDEYFSNLYDKPQKCIISDDVFERWYIRKSS